MLYSILEEFCPLYLNAFRYVLCSSVISRSLFVITQLLILESTQRLKIHCRFRPIFYSLANSVGLVLNAGTLSVQVTLIEQSLKYSNRTFTIDMSWFCFAIYLICLQVLS